MTDGLTPSMSVDRATEDAVAALRAARTVAVICHENPDADTLGGGLALERTLRRIGTHCEVLCADPAPRTLAFLDRAGTLRSEAMIQPDLVVVIDAATRERIGPMLNRWLLGLGGIPVLNVDHHSTNEGWGDLNLLRPTAAATSEIVASLVAALDPEPDPESATLLLAGILHDTDRFRTSSTSPETLRTAARLMEEGADMAELCDALFGCRPFAALSLWGEVLMGMQSVAAGSIVYASLTQEMLGRHGAEMLDAEDLPELLATVGGAEIAVLARDAGPAGTRFSLRTRGEIDASEIARSFDGGGHLTAAGFSVSAPLAEALELVLPRCLDALPDDAHERMTHAEGDRST